MKDWKLTWKDMADEGFREDMIGTKYIRWMVNEIGAYSPDRDWQWTKDLYVRAGIMYGRRDYRAVERACRAAIAAAGFKMPVVRMVYELAGICWERRNELGVPDEEGWF